MTGLRPPALGPRLATLAGWVRPNAILADVGTDHARLPVHLLLTGRVKGAIASDIGAGPLERARETLDHYGIQEIPLLQCDGLSHPQFASATDIVIAGMGGELIASILAGAPSLHTPDRHWLLKPMSRDAHLRTYLSRAGFALLRERAVQDGKHVYTIIEAVFAGVEGPSDAVFREIGLIRSQNGEAEARFIEERLNALERKRKGLESTALPAEDPQAIKRLIEAIKEADR